MWLGLLLAGPARAAPEVASERASTGPLRTRLSSAPADLAILYGGEQEGEPGPCGCPERPLGGLARVAGYRERVDVPTVLVNVGGWLDDTIDATGALRPDVVERDAVMVEGLAGWDVLGVGYRDLPYLEQAGFPDNAVSANLVGEDGPPPYRVLDVGGARVAVTSVSARTGARGRLSWADPVEALSALLPTIEADLVVVLAYEPGAQAREIARIPGVDVVVEAGRYTSHWAPIVEGDTVWVRSDLQTRSLGELRLDLGEPLGALDRKVDLDDEIPSDRRLRRLLRR